MKVKRRQAQFYVGGNVVLIIFLIALIPFIGCEKKTSRFSVLNPENFSHYVESFNASDQEDIINLISNETSFSWMTENIPFFECPDKEFEEIYYFRWWTYRKHIKQTPDGIVLTEFLPNVKHGGIYNTISCALGHQLMEGRWLKNQRYLDEYVLFWFRSNKGAPNERFHKFSSWVADALLQRYLVNHDRQFLIDLLPDLIKDYRTWETEKLSESGMFWQFDVRDGMEESISGSRKAKNLRPTINSYMYGNAMAIAKIAEMSGDRETNKVFTDKANHLKTLILNQLWDKESNFFKVRLESGELSDAREAIGFIPWYFNLPGVEHGKVWLQVLDTTGFKAPYGLTTAERRHPQFRSHGVGTCEWDGAIWPFATTQTLVGMANLLRSQERAVLSKKDYFEALMTYARAHHKNGKPYIGEYLDEKSGAWLKGDNPRSRHYNHSAFCDLVITGLVGLIPRDDNVIEINPLVPPDTWEWFVLDGLFYHGKAITILWDETGEKYKRGKGLFIIVDGKEIAHSLNLELLYGKMDL